MKMKISIFAISTYLLFFDPVFGRSEESLLPRQFAPAPKASISFVPTSSPSEIPSNSDAPSPLLTPSPVSSPFHSPPSLPFHRPVSSPFHSPPSPPFHRPVSSPLHPPASSPVSFWCVAKPNVPADKLQTAMDFACGTGGIICEDILPGGPCFNPNTVLAHANYAFNSYWQFAKNDGGNCDFDGAAMLVSSDPSFQTCHFVLI